jgi:hypothetical protein
MEPLTPDPTLDHPVLSPADAAKLGLLLSGPLTRYSTAVERNTIKLNLVDRMKEQYDAVLATLYYHVDECLKTFGPSERTAWTLDLEQMCSLLETWNPARHQIQTSWAHIGTPTDSILGKGSADLQDADVWYLTSQEFRTLISRVEPIRKCLVIRDSWTDVVDTGKIEAFLRILTAYFSSTTVEVQDLNGQEKHPKPVPCTDYVRDIMASVNNATSLSKQNPPKNLLNLKSKPILDRDDFAEIASEDFTRFKLLDVICQRAESTAKQMTTKTAKPDRLPATNAGKAKRAPTIFGREIDLQSCLTFGLFAQRGSFSGWHVDVLNGTYVTCVAGLKAWFIHQHPLTEAEKVAFAQDGQRWRPHPSRVKLILLRPGDTLYMPAGEVVPHAPVTVTDCLMKGGMLWDTLRMRDILSNIAWITENNDVTNESIPAQLAPCWHELEELVCNQPQMVESIQDRTDSPMNGSAPAEQVEGGESFRAFFNSITQRMQAALKCNCAKVCTGNICRCRGNQASDYKCTAWCHPKVKEPRPCML